MLRKSWMVYAFSLQLLCLFPSYFCRRSSVIAEPIDLISHGKAAIRADRPDQEVNREWRAPRTENFRRQFARQAGSDCWPRSKFALLEAASGCPSTDWAQGSVRHALRPTSSVSLQGHLRVELTRDSGQLNFCTYDPEQQQQRECPDFPAGSYCLFNGQKTNVYEQCPIGFHWSALGVDDVDYAAHAEHRTAGSPPTGEFFSTFTHYYLCCRNDSGPETAIRLPKSQPFILMPLHQKPCQKIHDRSDREFTLFLDTERESYVGHPDKNNAPFAETEVAIDVGRSLGSCSGDRYGKGLKLHLCHYA